MKKASPRQVLLSAVCWTVAAIGFCIATAWTESGNRLFVLRLLTAGLAVANAAIWWTNYIKMKHQEEQSHE